MTRGEINAAMPYAGPCGLCGYHDKRHRLWDMWRGRHKAGESLVSIARDYHASTTLVRAIVTLSPQAYGGLMRRNRP